VREVDRLTVHVLMDNTTDMLSSRPDHVTSELRVLREAGLAGMTGQELCCARHGLSLGITAHEGGGERTLLFDAGPDPQALEHNGTRMGFDFTRVEAIALSHGHFDHSEGLLQALAMIGAEVPLHVHPGAFAQRAVRLPDGAMFPLQDVPGEDALAAAGARVVACAEREEIVDGLFTLSGEIPRTSFERGLETHYRRGDDGVWEHDPLILDERLCAAHVRGKGIAIFTGCSHAGVLNICRHARDMFDAPLYALIGGLHLVHPNEDLIADTVAELREFGLQVIVPGHCTGWRAVHALLDAFGEGVVDPLAVGTRLRL